MKHNINVVEVTKEFVDKSGTVVYSDKNGFFLCRQGWVKLSLDDNIFLVTAGDLYIYPPFSQTYIKEVSEDMLGVIGSADFELVLSTISSVSNAQQHIDIRSRPCVTLSNGQRQRIEELLNIVTQHLDEGKSHFKEHILSALSQTICLEILDAYMSGASIVPTIPGRKDKILHQFLQNLFRNSRRHRDVRYYAQLQNLSPRHFSTVIRETSGRTPTEWINLSVIGEAKRMLVCREISIKEIATEFNFSEQSLFGRYFKRVAGISPQKFRKQGTF